MILLCSLLVPATAKAEAASEWDARIATRAVHAKRTQQELDDLDRSGVGLTGEIRYQYRNNGTTVRIEVDAGVFDYTEEGEDTRVTYSVTGEINQSLSETFEIALEARHSKNVMTLEGGEADQDMVRAQVTYRPSEKDQIEVYADYRWRNYADTVQSEGEGTQIGIRYRHSFKSYHWASIRLARDEIASDNYRRGYTRTALSLDYSHPISPKARIVAGFDLRDWTYDGRRIGDDATQEHRKDTALRPEIGLSYGRSKGIYVRGTVGYDWRLSNDDRYDGEGARVDVSLGYRF